MTYMISAQICKVDADWIVHVMVLALKVGGAVVRPWFLKEG